MLVPGKLFDCIFADLSFFLKLLVPHSISILILTHNRADDLLLLLKSLASLRRYDKVVAEILLLNNASTESYNQVEAFIDAHQELKVQYILSAENLGVAGGRNKLMRMAKGELLLTIDDDMIFPQRESLERMSMLFEQPIFKENNTAIITLKVIYYSTKEMQRSVFPHKKWDKYIGHDQFLTLYFAGGANLMKREVLQQSGYFPEDFFYGMEEYDLCYRVLDAGFSIGYDNSVTIEHKESPEGRQPSYKKLQMQWVNKSKVAWRYLPFVYFLSTAVMWSFQFLKIAKGHWGTFFKSWGMIFRISFTEKRKPVSKTTLDYLKKVEARLWF